jgi:hypothetical protein
MPIQVQINLMEHMARHDGPRSVREARLKPAGKTVGAVNHHQLKLVADEEAILLRFLLGMPKTCNSILQPAPCLSAGAFMPYSSRPICHQL